MSSVRDALIHLSTAAGRRVSDWFDAIAADEATTYGIHGAHSRADSHDELWVMDHKYIPASGEMSPGRYCRVGQGHRRCR